MARGWQYTNISLSSALLLSFSGICILFLFLSFVISVFKEKSLFLSFFLLSLELYRCSSDLFLSRRPRIGLATTYITGYD